MKCKKCGSESFETRIVDIINEKDAAPAVYIVSVLAWVVALISGFCVATILFESGESAEDLFEAIAGTLIDGTGLIILWKVFSGSVLTVIVCTLYTKLLPYKVLPIKKVVCKHCGAVLDENK